MPHLLAPLAFGGLSLSVLLFIGLLLLLPTIFWIVEIVDAARREFPDQTIKIVWLLVIFFTHFIGALIYYFVGKPQGVLR